ncbi:hypothetical protein EON63_19950 [archaeon]|nr:MAG: hypothetical protein EON63_19950 [archaeon]
MIYSDHQSKCDGRVGWASAADDNQSRSAHGHSPTHHLSPSPAAVIPPPGDYAYAPTQYSVSPRPPGQQHGRTAQVHFSYLSKQVRSIHIHLFSPTHTYTYICSYTCILVLIPIPSPSLYPSTSWTS